MPTKGCISPGARLLGSLLVLGGLSAMVPAWAETGIGVFVDKSFVVPGEEGPQVFVSGFNTSGPVNVDVHIGLFDPDGTPHEFPNWNTSLQPLRPWLANFTVPANFVIGSPIPVFEASAIPGGLTPGTWLVAAVLTAPGDFSQFIGAPVFAPFTVVDQTEANDRLGILTFSFRQQPSGATLDAGGVFAETTGGLTTLVTNLVGELPAIEQCVLNQLSIDFLNPADIPATLDAGASLLLSSSQGSVAIPLNPELAEFGYFLYETPEGEPSADFYQGGITYSFQGNGGTQIGPFSVSLSAPLPVNLSQPPLVDGSIHVAASDLGLVWNGNNGVGEVQVDLFGFAFTLTSAIEYEITCRFADDGNAAIPAALLTQLRDLLINEEFRLPAVATLDVSRVASAQFNTASGELSLGGVQIDAGVSMTLILE